MGTCLDVYQEERLVMPPADQSSSPAGTKSVQPMAPRG